MAQSKVYGDENPALTAVVGAVNGDTINYTLATTATLNSLMLGTILLL
jgi:hypothetical protein